MAPALAFERALGRNKISPLSRQLNNSSRTSSICFFCSLTNRPPSTTAPASFLVRSRRLKQLPATLSSTRRHQSTETTSQAAQETRSNSRTELAHLLNELQSQFPNYVDNKRVALALRNLSEPPGQESIRVAVLSPVKSLEEETSHQSELTAKQLVHVTLADELGAEAKWERVLAEYDLHHGPIVVRVKPSTTGQAETSTSATEAEHEERAPEVTVPSPTLGKNKLEFLVSRFRPYVPLNSSRELEESLLTPTVRLEDGEDRNGLHGTEIPVSTTPVHMTLVVGDGLRGALDASRLARSNLPETIQYAANFKTGLLTAEDLGETQLPCFPVNVDAAIQGLDALRAGNIELFSQRWSEGNVKAIRDWLHSNTAGTEKGLKRPVARLIESLLQRASAKVQDAQPARKELPLASASSISRLEREVAIWAENAHEELQQQLDIAFTASLWSKLGWWKLLWRADDVTLVTSEMIAQRFLPKAEKDLIHLTGRIQEAAVELGITTSPSYPGPTLSSTAGAGKKWPAQIPYTRNYLQETTVPSLHALAQKLVVQSAGFTGMTTLLAGLSYFSALGAYECGAIAALGLVVSLRYVQKKWNEAREYWEAEVREEGRKAVRATELSVTRTLEWAKEEHPGELVARDEALTRAKDIIRQAKKALDAAT
ncbi:hypothetical protein QBC35DRAFT_486877 [Podospora australis]|uniref:Mmc1 C-terminal domain-containing protein n=1 Tax=Podospora australis TaxID=1536484 RepID=A0AAN6X0Q4_9PEZI|nr:hypothetical protein QBC35DRAFT_486877 [Podospora australis]